MTLLRTEDHTCEFCPLCDFKHASCQGHEGYVCLHSRGPDGFISQGKTGHSWTYGVHRNCPIKEAPRAAKKPKAITSRRTKAVLLEEIAVLHSTVALYESTNHITDVEPKATVKAMR